MGISFMVQELYDSFKGLKLRPVADISCLKKSTSFCADSNGPSRLVHTDENFTATFQFRHTLPIVALLFTCCSLEPSSG